MLLSVERSGSEVSEHIVKLIGKLSRSVPDTAADILEDGGEEIGKQVRLIGKLSRSVPDTAADVLEEGGEESGMQVRLMEQGSSDTACSISEEGGEEIGKQVRLMGKLSRSVPDTACSISEEGGEESGTQVRLMEQGSSLPWGGEVGEMSDSSTPVSSILLVITEPSSRPDRLWCQVLAGDPERFSGVAMAR